MKIKIKNKLMTGLMGALAVVTMGAAMVMAPASADAVTCPQGTKNAGSELSNYALCNMDSSQIDNAGSPPSLWTTVNTVINVVLGVIGILAVIMIIYGGFKYTTSAGAADKVKSGKDTIMYGVIGLIIALLAFAIVNFVLAAFFNNNNTTTTSSGSGGTTTTVQNANGNGTTTTDGNAQSQPSGTAAQPPNQ